MEINRIGPDGGFVKKIAKIEESLKSLQTEPTGHIVVRETITTTDPVTGVKTIFGELPDGSHGIKPFVYDITPPPVATAPVVSVVPGIFTISWDGLFEDNGELPSDFECVNIIGHKMDGAATISSIPVGMIRRPLDITYITQDVCLVGETWQFSLESEDYNGNRAVWGDRSASVVMESVVSDQGVTEALEALQEAADAADAAAYAAQQAADAAQADADAVASNLSSTNEAVAAAQLKADQAFNNAAAAATAAGNAQTTADGKNRTWNQDTAPAGTSHKEGDIWFDTNDGRKLYLWKAGTTNEWVAFQDEAIGLAQAAANNAATAASTAQTAANTAQTAAATADSKAVTAKSVADQAVLDADAAQGAADQALADALAASNLAASKGKILYQTTAPTGADANALTLWIDTTGGANTPKRWTSGTTWVTVTDKVATDAAALAGTKGKILFQTTAPTGADASALTLWIDTTGGANTPKRWVSGTTWAAITDKVALDAATAAANAATAASNAQGTANTAVQDAADAQTLAQQAFDSAANAATAAGNAQTSADSKNRNWYQATAPAGTAHKDGDQWFDTDDGNKLYLWVGAPTNAWTSFQDAAISAAQGTANTALTSANGKTKTYYQTTEPSGGTYSTGDLWFDTDNNYKLHTYNGTIWQGTQDAAAAQAAAILAASNDATSKMDTAQRIAIAAQGYSLNPSFEDWSGALPANYTVFTNGPTKETSIVLTGKNAARFVCTDTATLRGLQFSGALAHAPYFEYLTVELDVQLVSGTSFGGSGVLVDWTGMTGANRATVSLASEIPTPTTGKWYRVVKVIRKPATATGTFTNYSAWLMGQYSSSLGTMAVKDVVFDWINVRPATTEEITTFGLPATITTLTGTVNSKTKTYFQTTSPGTSGNTAGDLWFDTDDGNKPYVWVAGGTNAWTDARDTTIATAQSTANTAVTAANGKNKVIYSTSAASGTTGYIAGDTWFQRDGSNNIIGQWEFTTSWQVRQIDNAVIANLNAAKLTAGILDAARIGAKTISTEKLVIGSTDNLISEPDFTAGGISWGTMSGAYSIDPAGGRQTGTPALKIVNAASQQGKYNLPLSVPINELSSYRFIAWVKSDVAIPVNGVALYVSTKNAAGTPTTVVAANAPATPADTWVKVTGIYKMPAGALSASFGVFSQSFFSTGNVWVDFVSVTRAADGELIVDGAITAGSLIVANGAIGNAQIADLNADKITAGLIAAARLDAEVIRTKLIDATAINAVDILATGSITATNGIIGSIDAAKITVGFLDAARLQAGSIDASKVRIGDFTNLVTNGYGELGAGVGFGSGLIYETTDKPAAVTGVFKSTAGQSTYIPPYILFDVDPSTEYITEIWLKASLPNSKIYVELRDQAGSHGTTNVNAETGVSEGSYALNSETVPTVWTKFVLKTTTLATTTRLRVGGLYFNHSSGTEQNAVVSIAIAVRRRLAGSLIVDGAITTQHMSTGTIDAGVLTAGSITSPKIAAKTIGVDKLLVAGSDTLIVEGDFSGSGASWELPAGIAINATAGRNSLPAMVITNNATTQASYNVVGVAKTPIDSVSDSANSYRLSAWVKSTVTVPTFGISINARFRSTTGTYTYQNVTYTTGTPPVAATIAANTWTEITGIVTAPANTISVAFFMSTSAAFSTGVVTIDQVTATRAATGELIVDGAITAGKIAANSITATNGIIASIDASKITVNQMSGARISAKTITVDKLVVSSTDNLVVEADFSNNGSSWGLVANSAINTTAGRGSMPALRVSGTTAMVSILNLANKVTVDADNKFRGAIYVKGSAIIPAINCGMFLRCWTSATLFTDIDAFYNLASIPANTWTQVSGITPTLPAGTKAVEFYVWARNGTTATTIDIDSVSMTRAADANLVVDGAIDGKTITGALFQTDNSPLNSVDSRGIKLNSLGFTSYDLSGNQTFNIDAITGEVSSAGTFATESAQYVDGSGTMTIGAIFGNLTYDSHTEYTGIPGIKFTRVHSSEGEKVPASILYDGSGIIVTTNGDLGSFVPNVGSGSLWVGEGDVSLSAGHSEAVYDPSIPSARLELVSNQYAERVGLFMEHEFAGDGEYRRSGIEITEWAGSRVDQAGFQAAHLVHDAYDSLTVDGVSRMSVGENGAWAIEGISNTDVVTGLIWNNSFGVQGQMLVHASTSIKLSATGAVDSAVQVEVKGTEVTFLTPIVGTSASFSGNIAAATINSLPIAKKADVSYFESTGLKSSFDAANQEIALPTYISGQSTAQVATPSSNGVNVSTTGIYAVTAHYSLYNDSGLTSGSAVTGRSFIDMEGNGTNINRTALPVNEDQVSGGHGGIYLTAGSTLRFKVLHTSSGSKYYKVKLWVTKLA